MRIKNVMLCLGIAVCIGSVIYFLIVDNQLRDGPLAVALHPIIEKKDSDASVVALAIVQNEHETRTIAAIWSALYWGFAWTSAVLSGLAGLILKLESVIPNEKVKKDVAATLTLVAALMVTVSTSGDFQRKWQANRTASEEIERLGYDFLQHNGGDARSYLEGIGDALQKRHLAILGATKDQKLPENKAAGQAKVP